MPSNPRFRDIQDPIFYKQPRRQRKGALTLPHLDSSAIVPAMSTGRFQQATATMGLALALATGFQAPVFVDAQEAGIPLRAAPLATDSNAEMPRSESKEPSPQAGQHLAGSTSRIHWGTSLTTPLSRATTVEFYTRIQPLLVNRCGAAGCHGRNPGGSFHLDVNGYRTPNWRRESSAANLQHVLTFIHHEQPDLSPLLRVPNQPHGGVETSLFTRNRRGEWERLMAWIRQVQLELKGSTPGPQPHLANQPINPASAMPLDSSAPVDTSADPFDPAAFNSNSPPTSP